MPNTMRDIDVGCAAELKLADEDEEEEEEDDFDNEDVDDDDDDDWVSRHGDGGELKSRTCVPSRELMSRQEVGGQGFQQGR